jgi:hypothetical protein
MGFMKFLAEDLPQFLVQAYYLLMTDCGKKNQNYIIYIGIALAVLNTYFGLLYRFLSYCYAFRKLNAFKNKLEVQVSNLKLANYGFRHIRDKIRVNHSVESLIFSGETYEYMIFNEASVNRFGRFLNQFPDKDKIEFLDINKIKFEGIR